MLSHIDERLQELEQEKTELTEYEKLDKQRRALQYTLFDKEYSKANDDLVEIEKKREGERETQQKLHSQLSDATEDLQVAEEDVQAAITAVARLAIKRETTAADLSVLVERLADVRATLNEASASNDNSKVETENLINRLSEVCSAIEQCEATLANVTPEYNAKVNDLRDKQKALQRVKSTLEDWYGKQGRGAQFSTKKERNSFLQAQIDALKGQVDEKKSLMKQQTKDIQADSKRVEEEKRALSKLQQENKIKSRRLEEINKEVKEKTRKRNEMQEERKTGWKELETLQDRIHKAKQELEKGKQLLNRSLPRTISQGLIAVEAIVEEFNIEGYFGPLIDNFSLTSDAFRTAVEVAAGNALFHLVVDTDRTAAFLMKELDKRRAGRLTFLPLNRLRNPTIKYPTSNEVRPLKSVALDYEPAVEDAMQQVFGLKLLAKDMDVAARFSKEFQLDAITKEGDQVNRKGGFEGGYRDEKSSKILAVTKIRESQRTLNELYEREKTLKEETVRAEAKVNDLLRELQQLESEREHLHANIERNTREISSRAKQVSIAESSIESRRRSVLSLEDDVALSSTQIENYQNEQTTPMRQSITESDRVQLQQLEEEQRQLLAAIDEAELALQVVASQKDQLSADLENNLTKTRDEIELQLASKAPTSMSSQSSEPVSSDFQELEIEREYLERVQASLSEELTTLDSDLKERSIGISKIEKIIEELRQNMSKLVSELETVTEEHDRLLNKRAISLEVVQTKQRLIRDLGTLPRKELDECQNLPINALMKKLKDVNESMKKYSNVNKKALDQYVSFSEQREDLVSRKEGMDRDNEKIQELLDNLDTKKDEAILRTFQGVSKHFSEVFEELVPGGEGKLVMRTTLDKSTDDADSDEDIDTHLSSGTVDSFQGVQIRVAFAGSGQQYQMKQLSGGQKAIVALALVFAIQRCDPAPFYLFDEIDQALDANYRANVAKLIQKQVSSSTAPAQFITTTFRPELVAVADLCFGIALKNKVSNIYPLDKVRFWPK